MVSSPFTSWQIDRGKMEIVTDFIFLNSKITVEGDCSREIETLAPWKNSYDQPRQPIIKQTHYFADKSLSSQSYSFSSNHVWIWVLDHKEGWVMKNWWFWTVALKKTLESPLDSKEIKQVNSKENQPWIFIEKTDAEAEAPTIWPPDVKNWLIRKDPDARKDWRQEEKWMIEGKMVGWHHWLDRHEFEQALGVSDGQGSLVCCSPWGHKELDETEWVNWTDSPWKLFRDSSLLSR